MTPAFNRDALALFRQHGLPEGSMIVFTPEDKEGSSGQVTALRKGPLPEGKRSCCGGKKGPDGPLASVFERVYVVNMDQHEDRLRDFWEKLETMEKGWPFKWPCRFRAVDGSVCPHPKGWKSGGGAWGCMQSHRRILEHCLMDGVRSVLVLEDDFLPVENFHERVASFLHWSPADWECLMVGGQHQQVDKDRPIDLGNGVVRCVNCQRTHAYALRGDIIKDLYREWSAGQVHCDWIMGPFLGRRGKTYAPRSFLAAQDSYKSAINGRTERVRNWPDLEDPLPVFCNVGASRETVESVVKAGLFHVGYDRGPDGVDKGVPRVLSGQWKLERWIRHVEYEARSLGCYPLFWTGGHVMPAALAEKMIPLADPRTTREELEGLARAKRAVQLV